MKFNLKYNYPKCILLLMLLIILLFFTVGCTKYELHGFSHVEMVVEIEKDDANLIVQILDQNIDKLNLIFYKRLRTIKPFKLIISASTENLNYNILHIESVKINFVNGTSEQYASKHFQFRIPKDDIINPNVKKRRFWEENDDFSVGYKINSDGIFTMSIHYKNVLNQYSDCTVYVNGYIQSDKGRNIFQSVSTYKYVYSERSEIGPRN